MTDLDKVKLLIGSVAKNEDALLTLLLEQSGDIVNSLTMTPTRYEDVKVNAVVFAYNSRGYEGAKSMSSGGGMSSSFYYDSMRSYIRNNMPAPYVIL